MSPPYSQRLLRISPQRQGQKYLRVRPFSAVCLIFAFLLSVAFSLNVPSVAHSQVTPPPPQLTYQAHPLPPSLAALPANSAGDYLDQIPPRAEIGQLIWSDFPVQVYVEASDGVAASQAWSAAISRAIADWTPYLPLQLTGDRASAGIVILRQRPPLRFERSATPQQPAQLARVRNADTRYTIVQVPLPNSETGSATAMLRPQFTIRLRPDQAPAFMLATARHELGHALGLWGHSPSPQDVMYFAQVAQGPAISPRDLNTLRRLYQTPTALGWPQPAALTGRAFKKNAQ
jgi:predicted Zn-dependent protease